MAEQVRLGSRRKGLKTLTSVNLRRPLEDEPHEPRGGGVQVAAVVAAGDLRRHGSSVGVSMNGEGDDLVNERADKTKLSSSTTVSRYRALEAANDRDAVGAFLRERFEERYF